MQIHTIFENVVQKYADKPALIFEDQPISFRQLQMQVCKMANVLKAEGVQKGDKVAFYLPNGPEYVYAYLACFYVGAVGVPLDFMLKSDELATILEHSETKCLLAHPKAKIDWGEIKDSLATLETLLLTKVEDDSARCLSTMMANAEDRCAVVEVEDTDPALIMYTSGTTGRPKGVVLSYKHLEGSPAAMHHFVDLAEKDTKLCALPLSHIGGFIYIQNCIHFGITVILMARFNPFVFLENVTKYKVTCFHIVPPMYNAILTLKEIERFDLSSLRWVVVFGAPSTPEIMQRFHKYCPNARLLNGWGMTETCPPNTVTPLDSDNIASVGKPAPHCTIKILDDENNNVPVGSIGEIIIDGWIVMDGYYKDEEATAAVKSPWGMRTGDLGRFDADGFLYIVGRKKEMIKVGGQIVYAPEVEAVLYQHQDIIEAAVIGIADQMKGEAVKAFVTLREGSDLKAEDVRYFSREHLAQFKVPQIVEIMDSLPKNRTGKIDKKLLSERI